MPWVTIADSLFESGKPARAIDMRNLRDNLAAMAAGDTGAPRFRQINSVSGAAAGSQVFTGLGEASGAEFVLHAGNTSGAASNVTIEYSTNGGSTWSAALILTAAAASNGWAIFEGSIDFASGLVVGIGSSVSASVTRSRVSSTMAGASLSIDALRFTCNSIVALVRPKGATV